VKVCILASGSTGNCIYLSGAGTGLLVDAGLGYRATVERLGRISTVQGGVLRKLGRSDIRLVCAGGSTGIIAIQPSAICLND
jgi:hypothetical protein